MPSTQYGQRKEYNITLETNENDCNYLPNIQYFAMNKAYIDYECTLKLELR